MGKADLLESARDPPPPSGDFSVRARRCTRMLASIRHAYTREMQCEYIPHMCVCVCALHQSCLCKNTIRRVTVLRRASYIHIIQHSCIPNTNEQMGLGCIFVRAPSTTKIPTPPTQFIPTTLSAAVIQSIQALYHHHNTHQHTRLVSTGSFVFTKWF